MMPCKKGAIKINDKNLLEQLLGDMLPPLKSYDFEVGASCSIAF